MYYFQRILYIVHSDIIPCVCKVRNSEETFSKIFLFEQQSFVSARESILLKQSLLDGILCLAKLQKSCVTIL